MGLLPEFLPVLPIALLLPKQYLFCMKYTLLLFALLAAPAFAAESSCNRYEIFTVYQREAPDEKSSVLLDKQTGKMWSLGLMLTTIADSIPVKNSVWIPAIKFENDNDANAWYIKEQEKLDRIRKTK